MHFLTIFSTSLALFSITGSAGYVLEDDYFAIGFFDNFDFFESPDPTHGFVEYQSYNNALDAKLISDGTSHARIGVDSTNITRSGRPSVRITSKKSYGSGLIVLDIDHMPGGICGTCGHEDACLAVVVLTAIHRPAFWTVGPNWPDGGEIDIIEGVNDQTSNIITLHNGPGCSISNQTDDSSGTMTSSVCTSSNDDNTGCQIASSNNETYGESFNTANGGVYAMEFSSSGINVYFFGRDSVPSDALSSMPNPLGWGTALASFGGSACDFGSSFTAQQIVFDTTFCGDWAGNTWSSSSCVSQASSCNDFVQNNPNAFVDAYWSINALRVYSNITQTFSIGSSPPTLASVTAVHVTSTLSSQLDQTAFAAATTSATSYQASDAPSTAAPSKFEPGWFSTEPGDIVEEWRREDPAQVGQ